MAGALVQLLTDPGRADAMGRAGYGRWNERFRPAAVAARLLDVYAACGAPAE